MEEFLKPMALSQTALANAIGVPPRRINEIVLGKRAVTADTDLRLARYFGMSEGFFLGLQTDYELMQRRREIGDKLKAIRPRAAWICRVGGKGAHRSASSRTAWAWRCAPIPLSLFACLTYHNMIRYQAW